MKERLEGKVLITESEEKWVRCQDLGDIGNLRKTFAFQEEEVGWRDGPCLENLLLLQRT